MFREIVGETRSDYRVGHGPMVAPNGFHTQEPTDNFYGSDMGVRDPFGNAIRILQRKKVAHKAAP